MKKTLSLLLSIIMLLSIASGIDLTANAYDNCTPTIASMKVVGFDRYNYDYNDGGVFPLDDDENKYYGMNGERLKNGIGVWIFRNFDRAGWVEQTYRLSSNYKELTGGLTIINEGNTDNFDTTVYFYDQDTLLASYNITNASYYKSIRVDVSGVDELRILFEDNKRAPDTTNFALYDMFFDKSIKTEHNLTTKVTKATVDKNGSIEKVCKRCGKTVSKTKLYKPKKVTLSKKEYIYNNCEFKPGVTIKDSNGNKISSDNYSVEYINNKQIGEAKVKIKFKGNYSGTITKKFTILPQATSITEAKADKNKLRIKWKRVNKVDGYVIQCSQYKDFSDSEWIWVKSSGKISETIKGLKSNKKYNLRVRTYKKVNGKKYYSKWSKVQTVKTK